VSHAFRFTPESGLNSDIAACLKMPKDDIARPLEMKEAAN
jgi:hypothetical protein